MKQCSKCKDKKPKIEFTKHSRSKDGLNCWCKMCSRNACKSYSKNNKQKISTTRKSYYESNKQSILQKRKDYQNDNETYKQYQEKYRFKHKEEMQQYRIKNKHYFAAKSALRRVIKSYATPSWLTDDGNEIIQNLYERCACLSESTGIHHNVDHIIPLQSELVCGLHVPSNLRIITKLENLSKGNKFIIE